MQLTAKELENGNINSDKAHQQKLAVNLGSPVMFSSALLCV